LRIVKLMGKHVDLIVLPAMQPCRWQATKQAIEDSLGWQLAALVDWIEEEPIASGSIGQVHRAGLSQEAANACGMPAGTVVAIKVKHPGVSRSIQRDFSIMMWLASQVEWIPAFKKLHISESLSQFAAPLREQVCEHLHARATEGAGKAM
jgi:aarF domain-containing kinase